MSIDLHQAKGQYASYKIKRLSPTHKLVLQVLDEADMPLIARDVTDRVNEKLKAQGYKGEKKTTTQIGGRLSELGAVGLDVMFYRKLEVRKTGEARWTAKPYWQITPKGRKAAETGEIP